MFSSRSLFQNLDFVFFHVLYHHFLPITAYIFFNNSDFFPIYMFTISSCCIPLSFFTILGNMNKAPHLQNYSRRTGAPPFTRKDRGQLCWVFWKGMCQRIGNLINRLKYSIVADGNNRLLQRGVTETEIIFGL